MRLRSRVFRVRFTTIVAVTIAVTALTGAALATPASGILSGAIIARAAFQSPVDIKIRIDDGRQEVIHVPDAQETVMQQIIIAPGGQTGWHSHPGPAVALVKSGALTIVSGEPGCASQTYTAGQGFVDSGQGHVHLGANLSTTDNAEVWVTYFDVPPGGSVRIDQPDPGAC